LEKTKSDLFSLSLSTVFLLVLLTPEWDGEMLEKAEDEEQNGEGEEEE